MAELDQRLTAVISLAISDYIELVDEAMRDPLIRRFLTSFLEDEGFEVAAANRASAALVQDLKERGMLDDTLVVWGGEFGRTPMAQGNGRDHHIKGFSMWMAGGGIKGGVSHGATDELPLTREEILAAPMPAAQASPAFT